MNHNQEIILHLSLISGIGPATIHMLIQHFYPELDQIYAFNQSDIKKLGLSATIADKLVDGLADKKMVDEEKNLIYTHNIEITTILDPSFPALLNQIYMPPAFLYVKGALLQKEEQCIAVVGSREANLYGKQIVESIIPELVAHQWTIVSGGALGADTYAHKTCLAHKGKTIAVLGSGLLKPYPLQNKKLFEDIIQQGGSLVSPFPLRADPLPGNFPARNRIIAGLSKGCLVVQAKQKSGARITAQFALEQGREVFAIPGSVADPLSQGCHELIKQGAKLTSHASDILNEFDQGLHDGENQLTLVDQTAHLSDQKKLILAHCINPMGIDELAQRTQLSLFELQSELFDLHIEGFIKQHFTGLWQRQ